MLNFSMLNETQMWNDDKLIITEWSLEITTKNNFSYLFFCVEISRHKAKAVSEENLWLGKKAICYVC